MKNFILIVGLNDKDSKRQEIPTAQAVKIVADCVLKYSDGATLTTCKGIYKHHDGATVYENSVKIEISGITTESAKRCAGDLKSALNQESIYFSEFVASVEFI